MDIPVAACALKKKKLLAGKEQALTQEQFVEKCKTINENLDLSQAVYKSAKTKVKLSCKIHPKQVFYMLPGNLYKGKTGCHLCLGWAANQEEFLARCQIAANENLDLSQAVYKTAKTKVKLSCKKHPEKVFYMTPGSIYKGYNGCKSCINSGTSQTEQDLADFIKSIYKDKIVLNDRTVLNGKELDIYLPDKQLAVEFNGVYWHCNINKPTNYHYDKYKECQDKNIRLIQIWEDTWDSRKETVKHFLQQELNTLPTESLKNTVVVTNLDTKTVKEFLNTYHLTGFKQYSYVLGLQHKQTNKLIAVMTFVKTANKGELLLSRFATKTAISGGFNTLIDTAKENCIKGLYKAKNGSKVRYFIVYTNNETDTGELYKNNGWQRVEPLPISYTYWHKSSMQRILSPRYNKHQFKTNPELQYLKGLNLKQLEELNSLYRCYDSGTVQWKTCI